MGENGPEVITPTATTRRCYGSAASAAANRKSSSLSNIDDCDNDSNSNKYALPPSRWIFDPISEEKAFFGTTESSSSSSFQYPTTAASSAAIKRLPFSGIPERELRFKT